MEWTREIKEKVEKLDEKYASIGQDLTSYLDGLLFANPLHYWDYVNVDTLLSLQHPKTDFPDEQIFIIYHQITELYFKLSLLELDQISNNGKKISELCLKREDFLATIILNTSTKDKLQSSQSR